MWTYVYPAKYSDIKSEDDRWKEERDRKLKEERSRSKDSVPKEDGKESTSGDCKLPTSEESRLGSKEPRPSVHVPVSSPLTQHQPYIPYMHGYSYSQSYDPNHPSYRGMPAVMMQNYPGMQLMLAMLPTGRETRQFSILELCCFSCTVQWHWLGWQSFSSLPLPPVCP